MPTTERLADQFEEHRAHLRAVAYRMLGSASKPKVRFRKAGFDSAGPMSATSRTCAPESDAVLADSVGLALLIVLDTQE